MQPRPSKQIGKEVEELRDFKTKHYIQPNGGRKQIYSTGLYHYKQGNHFEEIDTAIWEVGQWFRMDKSVWRLKSRRDKVQWSMAGQYAGKITATLVELDGTDIAALPVNETAILNAQQDVIWPNIMDGLELVLDVRPRKCKPTLKIQNNLSPTQIKFHVIEEHNPSSRYLMDGWANIIAFDAQGRTLQVLYDRIETGPGEYTVEYTFTNNVWILDDPGDENSGNWQPIATFPLLLDPDITETTADTEDGYDNFAFGGSGNWTDTATTMYSGYIGVKSKTDTHADGGVRFTTVGLDQGETIDLAEYKIYVTSLSVDSQGSWGPQIYGNDIDDAPAWSNTDPP
jgi:hypothetical protein